MNNCSSKSSFDESSDGVYIGGIGGLVGFVRFSSAFEYCSSYMTMPSGLTVTLKGLFTGVVFKSSTYTAEATLTDCKFGGSIDGVETTVADYSDKLVGTSKGTLTQTGTTYWDGN